MTYFPALRDATNDPDLRGSPLAVYVWLVTNHLDTQELRAVKINGLAVTMKIKRHTVSKALRLLVLNGYLERRYLMGAGYAYRAFLVKRAPLVPPNGHTQPAA